MRILLILLILLSAPLMAQDADLRALLSPRYRVVAIRSGGEFALAQVGYLKGDGEGVVLLRTIKGKWVEIAGGGGALGPLDLYRYGVPRRLWPMLLGKTTTPSSTELGPCWPETSSKALTEGDLDGRSAYELTLMRNEIFARHGKVFLDPLLHDYFGSRTWYRPKPTFQTAELSELEKKNAARILEIQQKTRREL